MSVQSKGKTFTPPWDSPRFRKSYHYASAKKGGQAARLIVEALPQQKQITWLDGGSGTGKSASFLFAALSQLQISFKTIYLVDQNQNALSRAFVQQEAQSKLSESNQPRFIAQAGDITDLYFVPDHSVHLYTLNSVMEHLDRSARMATLVEARRILVSGGVFQVVVPLASLYALAVKRIKVGLGLMGKDSIDLMGHIDHTHEEWYSAFCLVSAVEESGLKFSGQDFYIYGSIRDFWKVVVGSTLQASMPKALRGIFATGGVFVFQNVKK